MTRRETNAIQWLLTDGYKVVMGGFTNMHDFRLHNKDTNKIEHFDIDQVMADYTQNQKDEARMRASEKRTQSGWNRTI